MHGLWQTNIPSRFLDELPEANVEVTESQAGPGFGGYAGYGASRFDSATSFGSSYNTPGWQRAQAKKSDDARRLFRRSTTTTTRTTTHDRPPLPRSGEGDRATRPPKPAGRRRKLDRVGAHEDPRRHAPRIPLTIEGELIAKSTGTTSAFTLGDRVFHQKFGNGNVTAIDGNKLTIQFDRAGEKRVVDSFVERV